MSDEQEAPDRPAEPDASPPPDESPFTTPELEEIDRGGNVADNKETRDG